MNETTDIQEELKIWITENWCKKYNMTFEEACNDILNIWSKSKNQKVSFK